MSFFSFLVDFPGPIPPRALKRHTSQAPCRDARFGVWVGHSRPTDVHLYWFLCLLVWRRPVSVLGFYGAGIFPFMCLGFWYSACLVGTQEFLKSQPFLCSSEICQGPFIITIHSPLPFSTGTQLLRPGSTKDKEQQARALRPHTSHGKSLFGSWQHTPPRLLTDTPASDQYCSTNIQCSCPSCRVARCEQLEILCRAGFSGRGRPVVRSAPRLR